jgi:hypothetical protein
MDNPYHIYQTTTIIHLLNYSSIGLMLIFSSSARDELAVAMAHL